MKSQTIEQLRAALATLIETRYARALDNVAFHREVDYLEQRIAFLEKDYTMQKSWTFNIGLNRNDGRGANSIAATFAALDRAGFDAIDDVRIAQSNTEKTVVFKTSALPDDFNAEVLRMCEELAQDCIAYQREAKPHGFLVGPRAYFWGPFNPAFFLTCD